MTHLFELLKCTIAKCSLRN